MPIGGGSRTLAAALAPLRRLAEVVTELTLGVDDGQADPLAVAIIAPMHGPVVKQSLVELLSRWALLADRAASTGKADDDIGHACSLLACPAVLLLLLGRLLTLSLLRLAAVLLPPAACRYAEWTTQQVEAAGQSCVAVLYASAYGNTAGLAQAISRGITKAGGAHTLAGCAFGARQLLVANKLACSKRSDDHDEHMLTATHFLPALPVLLNACVPCSGC